MTEPHCGDCNNYVIDGNSRYCSKRRTFTKASRCPDYTTYKVTNSSVVKEIDDKLNGYGYHIEIVQYDGVSYGRVKQSLLVFLTTGIGNNKPTTFKITPFAAEVLLSQIKLLREVVETNKKLRIKNTKKI